MSVSYLFYKLGVAIKDLKPLPVSVIHVLIYCWVYRGYSVQTFEQPHKKASKEILPFWLHFINLIILLLTKMVK